MAESSVRAVYSRRDKIKFQATLLDPSQKNTIHVRQDKIDPWQKWRAFCYYGFRI